MRRFNPCRTAAGARSCAKYKELLPCWSFTGNSGSAIAPAIFSSRPGSAFTNSFVEGANARMVFSLPREFCHAPGRAALLSPDRSPHQHSRETLPAPTSPHAPRPTEQRPGRSARRNSRAVEPLPIAPSAHDLPWQATWLIPCRRRRFRTPSVREGARVFRPAAPRPSTPGFGPSTEGRKRGAVRNVGS